ncbi:putative reverse transcriptase, RNA-dependent DNA polymerase [Tanacetum coccineum]
MMAYHDKYKKILDEIWKDKVKLDGKTMKEDEDAVKRIQREALKEKNDPGAFIFPIRLEGKVNENAMADTGSDMSTMPYRIYEQLGRDDLKNEDRGITMIDHTQEKVMGKLSNVLYQVGVTTLISEFLILDIPIDRDSPIVVGRGFLRTMGGMINTSDRIFSTFDGFCHQTFRAARSDYMRNAESDSDDEEEYVIKRNKFGAPIYGPRPAPYLNCTNPEDCESAIQQTLGTYDDDAGSSRSKRSRHKTTEELLLPQVHQEFLLWEGCTRDAKSRAFNINEQIYAEFCHEFYSTYEFDKVCVNDELQSNKIIRFRLGGRAHSLTLLEFARRLGLYQAVELEEDGFNVYFEGGLRSDDNFNATDYWLSISREENLSLSRSHTSTIRNPILRVIHKMITYSLCQRTTRDLDTTTLRDLIDSDGKLIPEDPQPGVPRVGIPRPPRASMQDLYDRMGHMEIRQDAIERMEYRQSYHWDRYHGVFEHMDRVYSVPLQGAYNPLGYAQPQYDQCYQQYQPQQQHDDDE